MRSGTVCLALLIATTLAAQQPVQEGAAPQQEGRGAGAQGGRGGRGGRGAQPGLEPRIVTFEAKPATVTAGQPVLLVWHVENPSGVSIEPGIGAVVPRGSRQVIPSATTTYTLAVKGGPTRSVMVTVNGAAPRGIVGADAASRTAGIPRMADGHPDLNGVYGNAGLPQGTTPPPLKPGAEKFRIVRGGADDVRGRTTLTTGNDCRPLGIPQTYITPYPFQIVQTPKLIVIVYEYPMAVRFVPLGRAQAVDPDPSWMGTSVGRWDGDVLVIDAIGFNDKTEVHGFMHTDALHVVERFRKLESGDLQYEVTVEDPNVWQGPWVIPARTFRVRPEVEYVSEFVCESTVNYQRLFK